MKKIILNLIAVFFISVMAYANTNEIKETLVLETERVETVMNNHDDGVLCYEIGRTESTDSFTGITTITIYYRCIDLAQFF